MHSSPQLHLNCIESIHVPDKNAAHLINNNLVIQTHGTLCNTGRRDGLLNIKLVTNSKHILDEN
jgi:hypothetical protein